MDYKYLLHPLIGAIIGYITNWIAVKMLFKPNKPIYIGKFKLPFTPGIIPRNQNRLAHGISSTIANSLLNEDVLKENLLSEDVKTQISSAIESFLNSDEAISLNELIQKTEHTDKFEAGINTLINSISNSILSTIKETNLSKMLSIEIEKAINENMDKNFFTKIAKKPVTSNLAEKIEPQILAYIENNGDKLIKEMVKKEITKYLNTSSIDLKEFLNKSNIDLKAILLSLYSSIITNNLKSILETINITKVIENKINSMESDEIEKLVLSIINKELNTLVNLGAIIGFILGIINIFIK